MKKHQAIGLFSGGLDSILAVKLIQELDIEVSAIHFVTPFFSKKEDKDHIKKVADELGFKLKIIPLAEDYVNMVKQPKFGYGKNINPCIDCKIFMFKKAKAMMEKMSADFIFTGEVLGERPMSQTTNSLNLIEKEAGLTGKLLRPLSGKLLEPTVPEKEGIFDRIQLLDIRGRSRKPQMSLAKKFGITNYPNPAGGCLLTDIHYTERLKDAFSYEEDSLNDIELLKHGRHFRLPSKAKVVVGRNEQENRALEELVTKNDLIFTPTKVMGPLVILRNYRDNQDIEIAAGICARYSDGHNEESVEIKCGKKKLKVKPSEPSETDIWLVR
jgi:tRNA U34 2-thiouridine synthase MnmA/TrmU